MKFLNTQRLKINFSITTIRTVYIIALLVGFMFDLEIIYEPMLLLYIVSEILLLSYFNRRKYFPSTHPIVAIDIDGTILESGYYPFMGEPYMYAIETINRMQGHGYNVVIWSTRSSDNIIECRKVLLNYGLSPQVEFKIPSLDIEKDGINISKVPAFVYLDNRNYGYFNDYSNMWAQIHKDFLGISPTEYERRLKRYGKVDIEN